MIPDSWLGVPLFLLLIAPGLLFDLLERRRRAVPDESGFREASRIVLVSSFFTLAGLAMWLVVRHFTPRWTIDPSSLIGSEASGYAAKNLELLILNIVAVTGIALVLVWVLDRWLGRGDDRLTQHSA